MSILAGLIAGMAELFSAMLSAYQNYKIRQGEAAIIKSANSDKALSDAKISQQIEKDVSSLSNADLDEQLREFKRP